MIMASPCALLQHHSFNNISPLLPSYRQLSDRLERSRTLRDRSTCRWGKVLRGQLEFFSFFDGDQTCGNVKKKIQVFEGIDMVNNDQCIVKVLKPVAAKKINREIKILRNLTGGPNVVALLDVVRDRSARYHSLIMEYVENVEWKVLFPKLTEADIKYYTFQLLKVDQIPTHVSFFVFVHLSYRFPKRLWTLYIRMVSCIGT
jgi:hypothetical protein